MPTRTFTPKDLPMGSMDTRRPCEYITALVGLNTAPARGFRTRSGTASSVLK